MIEKAKKLLKDKLGYELFDVKEHNEKFSGKLKYKDYVLNKFEIYKTSKLDKNWLELTKRFMELHIILLGGK